MPYKSIKPPSGCNAFKDGTTPKGDGGELFKVIFQGRKGTPLADEKKSNFCIRKIGIFLSKIKMARRLGNSAALHCTCALLFVHPISVFYISHLCIATLETRTQQTNVVAFSFCLSFMCLSSLVVLYCSLCQFLLLFVFVVSLMASMSYYMFFSC